MPGACRLAAIPERFRSRAGSKWQMTDRHARRMIDAAEVAGNLCNPNEINENFGPIGPLSESAARPLAKLHPVQQRAAWKEAVSAAPNGKPTAKHVEAAVGRIDPTRIRPILPAPASFDAAEIAGNLKTDPMGQLPSSERVAVTIAKPLHRCLSSGNEGNEASISGQSAGRVPRRAWKRANIIEIRGFVLTFVLNSPISGRA